MKLDNPSIIQQIINPHFNSNTYVIYGNENDSVIIIDPGDSDSKLLIDFLSKKKINRCNVILTHEHYDHISGLKPLCSLFGISVFLSSYCFNNLNNPKKNLSDYLEVEVFDDLSINSFIIVQDNEKLNIDGNEFKFYYTPGHSEGSMCFGFYNKIFTGDTLMNKYKTITKLPGGNKLIYAQTRKKLDDILIGYEVIYPGHGPVYYI
jgi:hydroxyacylglutathione hydrolase